MNLKRLDELRNLTDGWLEGKGLAPNPDGLDWLGHTFEQYFPDELPLPFVYPTAEGGVQVEWSIKPNEVTLEIELNEHRGEWHRLDMATNEEEAHTLKLDNEQDWGWLAGKIRDLTGGAA